MGRARYASIRSPSCPRMSTVSANWASYRMLLSLIGCEHRLGHLARLRGAALIGREGLAVAVDATHRGLQALRLWSQTHVLQHEGGREYGGSGIGDALARDVRRRAVHRFEVGPAIVAEVAGGRETQAARGLRTQVGQDIAVEIHA